MAQPLAAAPATHQEMPVGAAPAPAPALPPWGQARLIGFRFVFSYLVLYNVPAPIDRVVGSYGLDAAFMWFWQAMVTFVGERVLHRSRNVLDIAGDVSGDSTGYFVRLLCVVALAAVATLVWTLVDRRSQDHRRLHAGLRVYVRYVLGCYLVLYGMIKVIKTQFLFPHSMRLREAYGETSPMGLLWTFMGYSTPYTVFAGAAEAGAGILLFFRRTTTLGALLAAAVMANVVMINLSYDVSVKLLSWNLLLMAVFLLAPDLRRLADLLVLHRPTAPRAAATPASAASPWPRFLGPRWRRLGRLVLKSSFIAYILLSDTKMSLDRWRMIDGRVARVKALGTMTYAVDHFVRNGTPVPPSPAASRRWQWLTFHRDGKAAVVIAEDQALDAHYDMTRQLFVVWNGDHSRRLGVLACSQPDSDHLVLTGRLAGDALLVRLERVDEARFFLVRRGFHWITEAPVNR